MKVCKQTLLLLYKRREGSQNPEGESSCYKHLQFNGVGGRHDGWLPNLDQTQSVTFALLFLADKCYSKDGCLPSS